MFLSQMKMYVPSVSYGVGMKLFRQPNHSYHCEKQIAMNAIVLAQQKQQQQQNGPKQGNKTFPHPFCMDCIHFVPVEHSSLFPNSGCGLFKPLKPCLNVRSDKELCGVEGKYFQKR